MRKETLYNKKSKTELKKKLKEENFNRKTLSFYKYIELNNLHDLRNNIYKSPIILICCKKILFEQMKKNKFKKKLDIIKFDKLKTYTFNNNNLNLIDVECKKLNKDFNTKLTNQYIKNSFELALKLMKKFNLLIIKTQPKQNIII